MLNRGRTPNVGLRLPLPVFPTTQASKVKSVVTESQNLAAGSAGTTGNFILNYAPVFSAKGDLIASLLDSSINMNGGADLTTEISFQMALNAYLATVGNPGYQDTGSPENPPDLTAALTNGQFYVIYETGRVYYKKASNGGTASITYNIRILEIEATFSGNVSENLAQVGGVAVVTGGVAGSQGVGGLAASGVNVAGNPTYIGGRAATALSTAVADGQAVGVMLSKNGKVVVAPFAPRELVTQQVTTIAASTSETTILTAAAAGIFLDLTSIIIVNTSPTPARVDIRDATAGAVVMTFYIPAGDVRGATFTSPFKQTTAANNWTATSSVSVTDLRFTLSAVQNN